LWGCTTRNLCWRPILQACLLLLSSQRALSTRAKAFVPQKPHSQLTHCCLANCAVTCPAGMLAAPESPTYLANKGKRDEAVAVATKLWGRSGASQLGAGGGVWSYVAVLRQW
jgi:hypothetical protein